jgi:hypothetical protein
MAQRIRSRASAAHRSDRKDCIADQPPTIKQLVERPQPIDKAMTHAVSKKREPLLTLKEVAEILKVSVKQVRRYIADPDPRKRLSCIDMGPGRAKRVDPIDLEYFIRVRRRP